jgi:hypothetical protein
LELSYATWFLCSVLITGAAVTIITISPSLQTRGLRIIAALLTTFATLVHVRNIFAYFYIIKHYVTDAHEKLTYNTVSLAILFIMYLGISIAITVELIKFVNS